jgi:hypothetical protein
MSDSIDSPDDDAIFTSEDARIIAAAIDRWTAAYIALQKPLQHATGSKPPLLNFPCSMTPDGS